MDLCEFEVSVVYKSKFQNKLQSYRKTLSQKTNKSKKKKTKTKQKSLYQIGPGRQVYGMFSCLMIDAGYPAHWGKCYPWAGGFCVM